MSSYRPQYRNDQPSQPSQNNEPFQFGQNKRHGFRFKPKAFERDLLTQQPTTLENPILSSAQTDPKFRDVEDVTDSDEAEMEEDSEFEDTQPIKKRKLASGPQTPTEQPVWSNPDPYTSLPPAPEVNGKRRDVVKLIRKARNESDKQNNAAADQDDFISFGDFNDDDLSFMPPTDAPTGPKADRYNGGDDRIRRSDNLTTKALGKRKRRGSDSDSLLGNPGRQVFHANGTVLQEWRESSEQSKTPWLRPSNPIDSPIVALHKEIIDFHSWVKPQEHETLIRQDLVDRLERELSRLYTGELEAFGSYAAGLHLPTGDMDLVYFVHGRHKNSSMPPSTFHDFVRYLRRSKLVKPGSVKPISGAKVPIIKFIDSLTDLRVDLSFHNTTGVDAIDTFKKWQATYPAMPIIVSVVKQFLMIRGLNDNSVGGLGGFSTICMVTSLLQHLPSYQNPNLGEVLVEFFNLYGNLLDYKIVGIRLDPPGYVKKSTYLPLKGGNEKVERLMIIDPNRADNNISGGSSEARRILKLFSRTHEVLCNKLDQFSAQKSSTSGFSFLEDLLGGNFAAYDHQRASLRAVYQRSNKYAVRQPSPPPPPPPPSERKLPPVKPPPPPPAPPAVEPVVSQPASESSLSGSRQEGGSTPNSSVKRLKRLRELRPDLETALNGRTTISKKQAAEIAGYANNEEMAADLTTREMALAKQKRDEAKKKKT